MSAGTMLFTASKIFCEETLLYQVSEVVLMDNYNTLKSYEQSFVFLGVILLHIVGLSLYAWGVFVLF